MSTAGRDEPQACSVTSAVKMKERVVEISITIMYLSLKRFIGITLDRWPIIAMVIVHIQVHTELYGWVYAIIQIRHIRTHVMYVIM